MDRIILIGGGGHCKSCIDVIEQTRQFEIVGIIDLPHLLGSKTLGYEVIGNDEDIVKLKEKTDFFLITIGQIGLPKRRKAIYNLLKESDCKLARVISPLAYVSKYATLGEGTIVMHQALINAGANIGNNCIINSKALVEHDVKIGNHCHISTNSTINGDVRVGNDVFYGSNAVCREGVVIEDGGFIKANSIVK